MAGKHAVMTGESFPLAYVDLDDGTRVDTSGEWSYVDSPEQAKELAKRVGEHFVEHGHPKHDAEHPFKLEE